MIQTVKLFVHLLVICGVLTILVMSGCVPNYMRLGDRHFELNEYQQALDSYSKAKEQQPANWLVYNRLGWTYYNLGEYDNAISQFNLSLKLSDEWGTHEGLGESYSALQQYEKALPHFFKWVGLQPADWLAHNKLGWCFYHLKNYPFAILYFDKANELTEVFENYQGLGYAYIELEDYKKAEDTLLNALQIVRDDYDKEQIKIVLASNYVLQGRFQEAYGVLGPKPFLGICIRNKGDWIQIDQVYKGSPAGLAGLKAGDELVEFNGFKLKGLTPEQFITDILGKTPFGSEVEVKVNRDGSVLEKVMFVGITPRMAKKESMPQQPERLIPKEGVKNGVRWAVIIGISRYQDTQIPSLRYAASDARAFYDWLISPEGGKYAPSRVKLLLDEEATGANIKKALFEWLREALEEDMVTIYFAGHGSPESPDFQGNLYLLPYDTQYKSIATTGFPMWDIETAFKRFIRSKKVVVMADACHSGGIGLSFDMARRANRGIKVNAISSGIQNLSQVGDGVCVISASSDHQFSQESKEWGDGHGVFTYFLLKGLKGDADYNKDDSISLGELTAYLSENVRRETKNAQSPTVSGRYDPSLTIER
ncbi:MAG: tetratricopeptide repeat protein [Deltaproteobacteria bacterium]|nr:tetratricopeptide repeat protein [Deltaproteobacteria bacterium]